MHLSSFCHPWKGVFAIKIMHENLFIHSECTGQEFIFHIQRQTLTTFKQKYHKYLRCFLEDLISLLIFLDSKSDRDKALSSVLWKDLPLVLLTNSKKLPP